LSPWERGSAREELGEEVGQLPKAIDRQFESARQRIRSISSANEYGEDGTLGANRSSRWANLPVVY